MNINEIAKLANVSRATVSRYFNDGYVSAEKREQIRRVIEETGYKPSAQAQMLRTKKTKQIGVIIPKINSESISGMISGISKELKQAGFWLLLANTENQEREEVEYLKLFSENQVDGIILIGTIFTPAHKRALRALQVPVVVLGQKLEGYSCVYQDDYLAAKESARMMLKDAKHPACLGVTKSIPRPGKRVTNRTIRSTMRKTAHSMHSMQSLRKRKQMSCSADAWDSINIMIWIKLSGVHWTW